MGYQPEQWHSLFEAIAGAAATLAGLIFVAVSLNLKEILRGRALPSVAARSLAVLVALVLMCTFGLAPGQLHTMSAEEPAEDDGEVHEIRLWWKIGHVTIAVQCTVPMIVTGASTWAGGGGLYWALAEIVCGLIASVTYAWVLLVEILRLPTARPAALTILGRRPTCHT